MTVPHFGGPGLAYIGFNVRGQVKAQAVGTRVTSRPRIDPAAERDYEFALLRFSRSEIRLVCPWHLGVFSRVPLAALSTNQFHPAGGIAHIRQGCGPWRREDAFILDRELELQVIGPGVQIAS